MGTVAPTNRLFLRNDPVPESRNVTSCRERLMPKKRRKLSKEMEADMDAAKRKIELISALINDIRDEDIQAEYLGAFSQIRSAVVNLVAKYTTDGFCEETEGLLALYKGLISQFEAEYEL